MKQWLPILLLMVLATGVQAEKQYRDFTDTQGRTIRGRILSYNKARGEVHLERDNGRTAKVPATIFSEVDREYIEKWNNESGVRSTSRFRVSCNRRAVKNWQEIMKGTINYTDGSKEHDQVVGKKDFEEVNYEIEFANRNSYPITDLVLEYCIYYEQEALVKNEPEAQQGILFGSIPIEKLDASEKKTVTTDSAVVFKEETNASFLNSRLLRGDVTGIWTRLYLQTGEEKTLVREEALPDSLPKSRQWATRSKRVGANR
jgi:hypothetical protein